MNDMSKEYLGSLSPAEPMRRVPPANRPETASIALGEGQEGPKKSVEVIMMPVPGIKEASQAVSLAEGPEYPDQYSSELEKTRQTAGFWAGMSAGLALGAERLYGFVGQLGVRSGAAAAGAFGLAAACNEVANPPAVVQEAPQAQEAVEPGVTVRVAASPTRDEKEKAVGGVPGTPPPGQEIPPGTLSAEVEEEAAEPEEEEPQEPPARHTPLPDDLKPPRPTPKPPTATPPPTATTSPTKPPTQEPVGQPTEEATEAAQPVTTTAAPPTATSPPPPPPTQPATPTTPEVQPAPNEIVDINGVRYERTPRRTNPDWNPAANFIVFRYTVRPDEFGGRWIFGAKVLKILDSQRNLILLDIGLGNQARGQILYEHQFFLSRMEPYRTEPTREFNPRVVPRLGRDIIPGDYLQIVLSGPGISNSNTRAQNYQALVERTQQDVYPLVMFEIFR